MLAVVVNERAGGEIGVRLCRQESREGVHDVACAKPGIASFKSSRKRSIKACVGVGSSGPAAHGAYPVPAMIRPFQGTRK